MTLSNKELEKLLEARREAELAALDIMSDVRMDDLADMKIILDKLSEILEILTNNTLNK